MQFRFGLFMQSQLAIIRYFHVMSKISSHRYANQHVRAYLVLSKNPGSPLPLTCSSLLKSEEFHPS